MKSETKRKQLKRRSSLEHRDDNKTHGAPKKIVFRNGSQILVKGNSGDALRGLDGKTHFLPHEV